MTNVKRQLKVREDGGWKRIEWSLAAQPAPRDLEVLQARLLAMDPKVDCHPATHACASGRLVC